MQNNRLLLYKLNKYCFLLIKNYECFLTRAKIFARRRNIKCSCFTLVLFNTEKTNSRTYNNGVLTQCFSTFCFLRTAKILIKLTVDIRNLNKHQIDPIKIIQLISVNRQFISSYNRTVSNALNHALFKN